MYDNVLEKSVCGAWKHMMLQNSVGSMLHIPEGTASVGGISPALSATGLAFCICSRDERSLSEWQDTDAPQSDSTLPLQACSRACKRLVSGLHTQPHMWLASQQKHNPLMVEKVVGSSYNLQ